MKPTFKEKQKLNKERITLLRSRATPSEKMFRGILNDLKIKYIFQKGFMAGDFYCIVDFYLPKPHKICFEIDGGYHNTSEQKKKDFAKDYYLTKKRHFRVIRFTNDEVLGNRLEIKKKLVEML